MKRTKAESSDTLQSNPKRIKFSQAENKSNINLSDFPDTVLLHIFQYVSSFDLMSLHLCCNRFKELCCDRSLWANLDLREHGLTLEELDAYVKFMQPVTKIVAIKAKKVDNESEELSLNFLNCVIERCEKIKVFMVEDFKIPRERIYITNFPTTLEKLSLKGTQILPAQVGPYLSRIHYHMPNLTCLILTSCSWLDSHSFMAISKLPSLKEVRMNSCHGLYEEVAYASLACIGGFKKLEVLDLRDTFVGDSVLSSFSHTSSLTEIYLERPSSMPQQPEELPERRQIIHVHLQQPGRNDNLNEANRDDLIVIEPNHGNNLDRCQVTDRSICSLGFRKKGNSREIIENYEDIQIIHGRARVSTNPHLTKLVIRNFPNITNRTLTHFIENGPNLEYLDVTGTSVTIEGLQSFKNCRPNVTLISSYDEI